MYREKFGTDYSGQEKEDLYKGTESHYYYNLKCEIQSLIQSCNLFIGLLENNGRLKDFDLMMEEIEAKQEELKKIYNKEE